MASRDPIFDAVACLLSPQYCDFRSQKGPFALDAATPFRSFASLGAYTLTLAVQRK